MFGAAKKAKICGEEVETTVKVNSRLVEVSPKWFRYTGYKRVFIIARDDIETVISASGHFDCELRVIGRGTTLVELEVGFKDSEEGLMQVRNALQL